MPETQGDALASLAPKPPDAPPAPTFANVELKKQYDGALNAVRSSI